MMQEVEEYTTIPFCEEHRGIGVQVWQSPARVAVVKAEIDEVFGEADAQLLFQFVEDTSKAPEARCFAAAKVVALFEQATRDRKVRPKIDFDRLAALTAGLDDAELADRYRHTSILDATDRAPLRDIEVTPEMIDEVFQGRE